MYFTQDDYLKIQKWLSRNSVRDTEFQEADTPFKGNETVTLVQNGHNRKILINDLIDQIFALGTTDFLNVSEFSKEYNITLDRAITLVPPKSRKSGQVISFNNVEGNWEIYQFTGNVNQWATIDLWLDIFNTLEVKVEIPDESIIGLPLGKIAELSSIRDSSIALSDEVVYSKDYNSAGEVWVIKNAGENSEDIFAYAFFGSKNATSSNIQYDVYTNPNLIIKDSDPSEIGIPAFVNYSYDSTIYHCEEDDKKYSFNNSRKIQEVFPKKPVPLQEAIDDIYAKLKSV